MKKNIILIPTFLCSSFIFSQVGINTQTPKATLDIAAKTTDGSRPEGIIAPRLTGDQIQAGDASYTTDQKGAIVYATAAATAPSTKTTNITDPGYYYFDGTKWQKMGAPTSAALSKHNIASGTYDLKSTDRYITVDKNATGPTVTLNLVDSQTYVPGQVVYISNLSYNNVQMDISFNGNFTNLFISDTNINYVPAQYQAILIYTGGLSSAQGSWAIISSNL